MEAEAETFHGIPLYHCCTLIYNSRVDYTVCGQSRVNGTARSREDETRNAPRNAKRNPRWSSQVSFQMSHLKRDLNFDHQGFGCAFRRAFRVSSSRERAVCSHEIYRSRVDCLWSIKRQWYVVAHAGMYVNVMGVCGQSRGNDLFARDV